ncbi:MAG: conserved phage C-terminal domain-containing protein [Clostridium sp.]
MNELIFGFNQQMCIEHNLNIKDLVILSYMSEIFRKREFLRKNFNGKGFYWVKTKKILEDFPALNTNEAAVRLRIKKLVSKGFLEYQLVRSNGTFSFYGEGRLLKEIYKDEMESEKVILESLKVNNEEEIEFKEKISEIIDYLNMKIDGKYSKDNERTESNVRELIKDGFTVEDFKTVIDKKYDEWKGTEYEKYIRPYTLFKIDKFENYLNQKEFIKKRNEIVGFIEG